MQVRPLGARLHHQISHLSRLMVQTHKTICKSPSSLIFTSFSSSSLSLIKPVLDLSDPHLWYPRAREIKRRIICHSGPTNSGKTWAALEALSRASNGIYCGPLRLLAFEVSDKLRKKGVKCNMITGNEIDLCDGGGTHVACTVEMANLNKYYEVAVLDEAQLIGDPNRGWAWTQALLGLQCGEIHVCGSPTMVHIITEIAKLTGDQVEICQHDRLSPLELSKNSLYGNLSNIEDGDCLISFDRKSLYKFKRQVETQLKKKCCIIYGSLPPEARREQAMLFNRSSSTDDDILASPISDNSPSIPSKIPAKSKKKSFGNSNSDSNGVIGKKSKESVLDKELNKKYNILLATDAIGMGLNLSIRRIVFVALQKFNGEMRKNLTTAEIKQIAGRAGRFQSKYETGTVTCLNESDMDLMRKLLTAKDLDIKKCGYFMSADMLRLVGLMNDFRMNERMIKLMIKDKLFRKYGFDPSPSEIDYHFGSSQMVNQYGEKGGLVLNFSWVIKNFDSIRQFSHEFFYFIRSSEEHRNIWRQYSKRYRRLQVQLQEVEDIEYELRYSPNHAAALSRKANRRGKPDRELPSIDQNPKPVYESAIREMPHSIDDSDDLDPEFKRYNRYINQNDNDEFDDNDSSIDKFRGSNGCTTSSKIDENTDLFDSYEPTLPLSKLMDLFSSQAKLDLSHDANGNNLYFVCKLEDFKDISDELDDITMPFSDKYLFCCSPVNTGDKIVVDYLRYYAHRFSLSRNASYLIENDSSSIDQIYNDKKKDADHEVTSEGPFDQNVNSNIEVPLNIDILYIDVLSQPVSESILEMEEVHRAIDLYRWLAVRFPHIFTDTANASVQANHCSSLINHALLTAKFSASDMDKSRWERRASGRKFKKTYKSRSHYD